MTARLFLIAGKDARSLFRLRAIALALRRPRVQLISLRNRKFRRIVQENSTTMEIKRWPDVEAEIQRVIDMHQTHWLAEIPDLHNETLVFLARHVRTARSELFGRPLQEISKRVMRQATNSI